MLIVTGVRGVVFVGRLCWELMYLPFDLADVVLNGPRPSEPPKPANIQFFAGTTKKNQSKPQRMVRSAA